VNANNTKTYDGMKTHSNCTAIHASDPFRGRVGKSSQGFPVWSADISFCNWVEGFAEALSQKKKINNWL